MPEAYQLKEIYKEHHLDITSNKAPSNTINFENHFQEELPAEAIDLKEYLRKYKEKDQTQEFNIEEIKAKAQRQYQKCVDLVPEKQ